MSKKRILICPLNWGLGHGTRDIPIISWFIKHDYDVLIGASGRTLEMLQSEFDGVEFIDFPDYGITYSRFLPAALSVLIQFPKIIIGIFREHFDLKKIIVSHHISAVISDNRYGLFLPNIPSVFITHQILIKPPRLLSFLEIGSWFFSSFFALKFAQTWIPDNAEENNLSGDLSHKYPIPENGRFIGPLTVSAGSVNPKNCDILVLISGPEPGRTEFEKIVLNQIALVPDLNIIILLGKPELPFANPITKIGENCKVFNHLPRKKIFALMKGANLIISRPGYTTVMEVASMGKKAFWIPTPGQTEQEYLASLYMRKGMKNACHQNKIDIPAIWANKNDIAPMTILYSRKMLNSVLSDFTELIDDDN